MANRRTDLNYGLYFAVPADGAAAQAAMGGLTVNLAPEAALALFPTAVFLVLGPPYVSTVPGVVDLGTTPISAVARTPSTISTATLSTTVHEVTSFNGVVQIDVLVDYVWSGTIMYTSAAVTVPPVVPFPGTITGKYEQQVVTWTGNGAANRLIPTIFSLASGTVAIWGCGGAGVVGFTEVNFFRHNASTMLGTAIMGVSNTPIVGQGIVSFEAGGFRVSAGNFVAPFANTNGVPYVAVVMRDTTTDRRYLRVGTYINKVGGAFVANVANGSTTLFFSSGGGWSPSFDNLRITDGVNIYTFHYVSSSQATLGSGYIGAGGLVGFSFVTESPHLVPLIPTGITAPAPFRPTHLWVWGSTVAYKSFEFPGAQAVTLALGGAASAPVSDMLTALNVDSFTVQDAILNGSVWAANFQYDYVALNADAALLARNIFASFTGLGAAVPPTVVALPFTPVLVFGRQGGPVNTGAGTFRGPAHTGTQSSLCSNIGGGTNIPTDGIVGIGAGTVSLQIEVAPIGAKYYGWAFVGGGTPGGTSILASLLPVPTLPTPAGLPINPNPAGPAVTDPGPTTPPVGGGGSGNCPPCVTLTSALATLASRLQDTGTVHWTAAELTRYLTEAQRTWNALTGEHQVQATFASVAQVPFYDLATTLPAYRAYTITDTYLVSDLEYALMEPPTGGSWTGTAQFTFQDLISALQQRRDQFLLETGMVITRVVQALAGPPASGRFTLDKAILTLRRLAFINAIGAVYPLQRDDEWSATAFDRKWPARSGVPISSHPIAYSVSVTPPLQCQVVPPLSTIGTLDMLAVTRAAVMGGTGPCLDPAVGILLGVPDDWTWVVKWGALATLLGQQGVTYDPQRAAYCEARWRHGILLATKAYTVLAARINGVPCPITSVAEADQYSRSWQRVTGTPTKVLLAGTQLVALAPPSPDVNTIVTLDLVRNAPVAVIGTDCLAATEESLEPVLAYAQHLAMFKEGPSQLQAATDLLDRFFRAAGVVTAIDLVSSPNKQAIQDQSRSDERQLPRTLVPPPIQTTGTGGTAA